MRAVSDDYQRRSMEELGLAALAVIKRQPGLRCGGIGDQIFGDHATLRGSAPFARLAGKIMRRLEREGLAVPRVTHGWDGWHITMEGEKALDT